MYVDYEVKVDKLKRYLSALDKRLRFRTFRKIVGKTATEVIKDIKKKAPRSKIPKTLHLADSFSPRFYGYSKVRIVTPVPYASYIEEGTRPSPGRYVPYICRTGLAPQTARGTSPNIPGRRLTSRVAHRKDFGTHPGVPAFRFVSRSIDQVSDRLPEIAARIIQEALRR